MNRRTLLSKAAFVSAGSFGTGFAVPSSASGLQASTVTTRF
jgi:hypothetical protein